MSALRVVGGIFAVAFFALALIRYQRRQISRLNLIISSLISAVVFAATMGVLMASSLNADPRTEKLLIGAKR